MFDIDRLRELEKITGCEIPSRKERRVDGRAEKKNVKRK